MLIGIKKTKKKNLMQEETFNNQLQKKSLFFSFFVSFLRQFVPVRGKHKAMEQINQNYVERSYQNKIIGETNPKGNCN